MRALTCLLLVGWPWLAAAADGQAAIEAAARVKAAWPDTTRRAFGFEDARLWGAGETVAEPKHGGAAAVRWARHKTNGGLTCQVTRLDLSAFNELSFWLHSSQANGESFYIIAESQRQKGVLSYFSYRVIVDWTGWRQITVNFREFGQARQPVGWQQIDHLRFTATGWDQNPSEDAVWVLDDLDFSYNPKPFRRPIRVQKYVTEPAPEAFRQRLRPGHPRLILRDEDLTGVRRLIAEDPLCAKWYEGVKKAAADLAARPPRKHELPDGRRLLSVSRDVLERLYHWGLLYRLEGDRKWLERAWQELQAVVNFPDWNPNHYLDTAEMMHAVAIGYDWFYGGWTDEQRKVIREGLWRHGLRLSHASYLGLPGEGQQGWREVTNNWNFVCNGGSSLAAMALLDELPEPCTEVLRAGFQYIQIPLHSFEPDGAWWEGIGYWGYSMMYLLSYLRGLETTFGTDFGLVAALAGKGFAKSGDFPIYLTSPSNGYFNFADSGDGGRGYSHWGFFYLAARYRNPLYLYFQRRNASRGTGDVVYYEPFSADLAVQNSALDRHFRGAEVGTMRGSWTDANAVFVGLKSGRNGIAHAHQDLGSFAFYGLGEKWVMDLGTEGQTYQSHKHHVPHLDFYRIRAEGHNTLVFNPRSEDGQDTKAPSRIVRWASSPDEAQAVVDLSEAYRRHADSVQRGLRLFDQRRALLVQDEIRAARPNDVWWFAHGDAGTDYQIAAGGREVVLTRNGKLCRAVLLSPAGATFEVLPARPLPTSPDPPMQHQNKGLKKLAVHLPQAANVTISVLFRPRFAFEPEEARRPEVPPIADWKLPPAPPQLAGLAVGGTPLADFTPQVFTYTVEVPAGTTAAPTVTATPAAGQRAVVTAAAGVPGTAQLVVTDPATNRTATYLVRFGHPPAPARQGKTHYPATAATMRGITVTASGHDGNEPKNVLDDDPDTRWSASGEAEWLAFDFGTPRRVEAVRIAWYSGDQRQSRFRIETSSDAKTWRAAFAGQSSGKTADLETYRLDQPATVRYLRLACGGNTENLWNSITTVRFVP